MSKALAQPIMSKFSTTYENLKWNEPNLVSEKYHNDIYRSDISEVWFLKT